MSLGTLYAAIVEVSSSSTLDILSYGVGMGRCTGWRPAYSPFSEDDNMYNWSPYWALFRGGPIIIDSQQPRTQQRSAAQSTTQLTSDRDSAKSRSRATSHVYFWDGNSRQTPKSSVVRQAIGQPAMNHSNPHLATGSTLHRLDSFRIFRKVLSRTTVPNQRLENQVGTVTRHFYFTPLTSPRHRS